MICFCFLHNFAPLNSWNSVEGTRESPLLLGIPKEKLEQSEQIAALVQAHLADSSLFPVAVEVKGSVQRPKVVVLLDGDAGVKIDDCAKVSRWLGQRLEELNVFENAYTLEVSSPGVDFPLTQPRQYPQHTGRTLNVTLTEGETVKGTLESVHHDRIVLLETRKEKGKKATTQPRDIPFTQIEKAQVQVSFK